MCLPGVLWYLASAVRCYRGGMSEEHALTVRLDDDRWQQLRREAFVREIHKSDIVRQALDEYFAARAPATTKENRP